MNRRSLLCSLGLLGRAGLTGCLDSIPPLDESSPLGRLSVSNRDQTASHTFDLRVERDVVTDCTWDGVTGTYTAHARVEVVSGTGSTFANGPSTFVKRPTSRPRGRERPVRTRNNRQ